MKFLIDNQLPGALARFIVGACGRECEHVLDVGLAQASDTEICEYVEQHGITLITKDEDFLHLAMRPGSTLRLVWVRIGNCRKQDLLASFGRAWPRVIECLDSGDRIVELR